MVNPAADQPLAALVEGATGIGPAILSSAGDHLRKRHARHARFQREVDQLNAGKAARFQADPLSDEIRRIASYQQSFNEMARGERRFVQEVLRGRLRARERWMSRLAHGPHRAAQRVGSPAPTGGDACIPLYCLDKMSLDNCCPRQYLITSNEQIPCIPGSRRLRQRDLRAGSLRRTAG